MATIGSSLPSPESGWTRFDNTNSLIKYTGSLFNYDNAHALSYQRTLAYIPAGNTTENILTHKIEFSFVGTKLRIIGVKYKDYSARFSITVDEVEQIIDLTSSTSDGQYQTLLCEFSDLEDTYHKVKMKSLDGLRYTLDCIDVDSTGYLCDERFISGEGSINVSHTRAFHAQTLPMNTTEKILAKRSDWRAGLLGMANDGDNYGDLYVVGNDGKSHLIKSGIKSEVIFDGVASSVGKFDLSNSINSFKTLIVIGNISVNSGTGEQGITMLLDVLSINNVDKEFFMNWSFSTYDRRIFFTFEPSKLSITLIKADTGVVVSITKVVGIY